MPESKDQKVVWAPIPNTSQEVVLSCPCDVILYTGDRGPGKTDTQLMMFRKNVGIGYGPFWRGIILDREHKNLDDLVAKSKRWFYAFNDGARFLSSQNTYKWVWPGGEELLLRAAKQADDYYSYHGQEFPFLGWNELTKYPTSDLYDAMMSTNRSSFTPEKDNPDLPPIPLVVVSTTNPFGPGHAWVKRRFIDVAPYGEVVTDRVKVYDPKVKKNVEIEKTQVAIFGSHKENIYLDPQYIATLMRLANPQQRKAWLEGSWDIVAGGILSDKWDSDIHKLPKFKVPSHWIVDRGFDWGSAHPFAVGWFAEATGEEVECYNGAKVAPPRGSIIQIAEWYGCLNGMKGLGSNKGLRLSAGEIAKGILAREADMMEKGLISTMPAPGPADGQIYNRTQQDEDTIAKKMEDWGVRWTRADKSPGSRVNGLEIMRERLQSAIDGDAPGLYITDNCPASLATVPSLPADERKPDDVDTNAEDHLYDVIRYRVLAGNNRIAKRVKVNYAS